MSLANGHFSSAICCLNNEAILAVDVTIMLFQTIITFYFSAWMASKDIVPYQKYKERFRSGSQKTALRNAVWEAEEDPNLELSKGNSVLRKYTTTGKKV